MSSTEMGHSSHRATVIALALLFAMVDPAAATDRDAMCRYKVGVATRTFAFRSTERVLLCQRERMEGKISPSVDCSAPSTWAANGFSRGLVLRGKDTVYSNGTINSCHADATLAGLGYAACPAPCAALPVNSLDELASCMRCVVDDCVFARTDQVLGAPPLPILKPARKCQERIARNLTSYLNSRMYVQHLCQVRKERGYANYVGVADCKNVDSPAHPSYAYLISVKVKLDNWIDRRCAEVTLASELDTCAASPAGVAACLRDQAEICTDPLFDVIFP